MKKPSPTPVETSATTGATLGLDLGDLRHSLCALDSQGAIIEETSACPLPPASPNATARKLAVVMQALLQRQSDYRPLREQPQPQAV